MIDLIAAYRDRTTGRYPITLDEVRILASGFLFGPEPTPEVLDAANVDPVAAVDPPAHDPATHFLREGDPEQVGGSWRQTWAAVAIPPPPVPSEVTMRQARIALSRAGVLARASKAIADMPGQAGEEARIEWDFATTLRRDHPLVAALGESLGLTSAQIDALFVTAAGI